VGHAALGKAAVDGRRESGPSSYRAMGWPPRSVARAHNSGLHKLLTISC
jgi:hypothetical protein